MRAVEIKLHAALAKLRALELDDCPQADMDCPLSEKYDEEIRDLHTEISNLHTQLSAALARVRGVEAERDEAFSVLYSVAVYMDFPCSHDDSPGYFLGQIRGKLAAARAEAVKQAFEWLECNVVSDLHLGWADHVGAQYARYLASLAGKEPSK